ncbi:MAG: hypothetical protein PIR02_16130 [Microbacterium enclense]
MEISVEFASVLAQIMPTFLLVALFERFVRGSSNAPRPGFVARRLSALGRYVVALGCFTVFVTSLVIVATGEAVTGGTAIALWILIGSLVVVLWFAVDVWYAGLKSRANEDDPGDPEGAG